jgi:hypothetical protein
MHFLDVMETFMYAIPFAMPFVPPEPPAAYHYATFRTIQTTLWET